jgi:hypothetical protein
MVDTTMTDGMDMTTDEVDMMTNNEVDTASEIEIKIRATFVKVANGVNQLAGAAVTAGLVLVLLYLLKCSVTTASTIATVSKTTSATKRSICNRITSATVKLNVTTAVSTTIECVKIIL